MTNKGLLISVIIPIYNVEKYLPRCIDSILSQTFTNFEILLIDDGSTDLSGKICDEYAKFDTRIRVFHKKNGGVGSARNVGLNSAKGEWICFCDSDDYVLENWLMNFSHFCSNSIDIILSGYISSDKTNTRSINLNCYKTKDELISNIGTKEIWGYLWCKCFKKEIINKYNLRFNTNYKVWEDAVFIYKYFKYVNTFKIIKSTEYFYIKPNYKDKYSSENKFFCCEEILQDLDNIVSNIQCKPLYKYYIKTLFTELLKEYKHANYKIAYIKLRKYAQIVSHYQFYKGVPLGRVSQNINLKTINLMLIISSILYKYTIYNFKNILKFKL